jgi:serine/threonine protein kinase
MSGLIAFPIQLILLVAACVVGVWLIVKLLAGLGWAVGQIFRFLAGLFGRIGKFVGGMVTDTLRLVGGGLTAIFFVPFVISNIALGRWSRANHYGKALEREVVGIGAAAYRVGIGHLGRLLGLTSLTDGIERRIPEAMARAPSPDTPRGRPDAFDGYTIVGSLPTGGSGARLYLAEALPDKRQQLTLAGLSVPQRVVIKSFSLSDGSTMPQIVRESRALEAARKLGLVLEHELSGTRFHYVMPYVPGEDLSLVTQRLHDQAGSEGLSDRQLGQVMSFTADLLQILQRFHAEGLWHKDIKPSNIIVSDGRVHLVDLGLTTPLRSAMTLTTHGTEYFRDPELVRLALRGVKVHEVDGVKFDIYGAGAVLYSVIENSFPAHGSLSQIRSRCPEALRWIVRRAMADMGNRYASTVEMLADLRTVMAARDPFQVTPASLPSVSGDPGLAETISEELRGSTTSDPFVTNQDTPPPSSRVWKDRDSIAATSRRGGVRWGSVAAAIVMTLTCVGVLGALFLGVRSDFDSPPAIVLENSGGRPPSSSTRPSRRATGRNPIVAPSTATVGTSHASHTATLPIGATASHREQAAAILVLDDARATLTQSQQSQLDALFVHLEQANFQLVGIGRQQTPDDDEETALLANALHTIGQADRWDTNLRTRLREFLVGTDGSLQAVLAVDRGDREGSIRLQMTCLDTLDRTDITVIANSPQFAKQGFVSEIR